MPSVFPKWPRHLQAFEAAPRRSLIRTVSATKIDSDVERLETVGRTVGDQESTDTALASLVSHDHGAYFKPTASAFQRPDEDYSFQ